MTRLRLPEGGPGTGDLTAIASVLAVDGVAILPTDTIYGLHSLAGSERAVERIIALKRREEAKPLLVLAASIDQLLAMGAQLTDQSLAFLSSVWPAALTAVLPVGRPLAATRGGLSVGARIPALEWLRQLIAVTGPLASTSVNLSRERPIYTMQELPPGIEDDVDLVVDSGTLRGEPSTVVDFTTDPPRLLREGGFNFTQKLWKNSRKTL
jgi:L-threonylcarbamoyladenylate synthase